MKITELLLLAELDRKAVGIRKKLEIGITMRYVKIAEHYKVEAVEKLERYRAVQMQEVEKRLVMIQEGPPNFPNREGLLRHARKF